MTPTWGTRMRLAGGTLAHYAGADRGGSTLLAHGDYAWTDTLRPAADSDPDCPRCVRKLPGLARLVDRAVGEGFCRRCTCGQLGWAPDFRCGGCGTACDPAVTLRP